MAKRRNSKVATESEIADLFDAADWQIWAANDCPVPENQSPQLADHLATTRMMWLILTKTKPEVLESAKGLWNDSIGDRPMMVDLVDRVHEAQAYLKALTGILNAAEARLMTASCKLAQDGQI